MKRTGNNVISGFFEGKRHTVESEMSLAEIKCFFIYHFQTRRKSSFTCITSVWSPKFVYNTVFVVVSSLSCV